jgi:hypothetical protein
LQPTVYKSQVAVALLALSSAAGCAVTSPPASTGVDAARATRLMAPGELEKLPSQARLIVMPGVGHFEIASPRAGTWPRVSSVIQALLEGALPEPDAEEER